MSQDNTTPQQQQQPPLNGTPKHPSLDSQRRRPSSIAEQAMRKLGLNQRYRNFYLKTIERILSEINFCIDLICHYHHVIMHRLHPTIVALKQYRVLCKRRYHQ